MKESNDIEKNIESLEQQLRAMGEPYSNDMPSDAYFADFQSRLMTRIASEQTAPVPITRVSFVGSPMRITALVGAVALVIAGFFYVTQSNNNVEIPAKPSVVAEAPKAVQNEVVNQIDVNQTKPEINENHSSMQDTNPPKIVESPKQPTATTNEVNSSTPPQDMMSTSANFETMDELSVSDPEAPVTYDKLSIDELESVLRILESNEFESER